MRDLAFLREPVAGSARGLDSVDPVLAELTTLADKDDLPELQSRVEALFDDGVFDVRPITYYLWIAWRVQSIPALPDIFRTLAAIATTNLGSLGPAERREAHFAKRVGWLLQKVGDLIQYNEAKRTPEWKSWETTVKAGQLDAALEALRELDGTLVDGLATARQALMALAPRLQTLRETFSRPIDDVPPAEVSNPSAAMLASASAAPVDKDKTVLRAGRVDIGVSAAYFDLVDKLEAFRVLVEKNDLQKASVVADDLMRLIENFDPTTFFPELFADFSEKLSSQIEELSPYWADRESFGWKAMVQFYRVDLRRFVGR
jgi:hypothetical protein